MFTDKESQLAGIAEIFAECKQDGLDMTQDQLYTYYFVDNSSEKLEKFGARLEAEGYDMIDIFELGDEATEQPTGEFLLHLDKLETHTAESLAARNVELTKLAEAAEITGYDGWEVGELDVEEESEN